MQIVPPSFEILTPLAQIADYLRQIEAAGRTCYKSEARMDDDSAAPFVRRLVRAGHQSVIEHCAITVRIVCDRSTSHQLVRHRLGSFSQESQRYVDYGKREPEAIVPPRIADDPAAQSVWRQSVEGAYKSYLQLRELGVPAEDARSVLPNALKTEVVATFNLRQWRHVFQERALNRRAQWEIRDLFMQIFERFCELLPDVFGDLVEDPQPEV
ncbi:MAG: FAD-dependent thymidylate synthase [Candidatus Alcyoniella australis]|nr:FAD-dependent thymidylate synthase [Candidatus Alcyoniella australis]